MNISSLVESKYFVLILVVVMLQLLLCYKAKKLSSKLAPVISLVISTIIFYALYVMINKALGGWNGIVSLYFAFISFCLAVACGLGLLIWAIIRLCRNINKRNIKNQTEKR